MKIKRMALVVILIAIFVVCLQSMNDKYDPLARYKYNGELTSEQRDLILNHMDNDDIDFMIQQKLKPEQYLKYINIEGFNVKHTLYYELCAQSQPADLHYLVYFVNKYKSNVKYGDLETMLMNYSYANMEEFYNGAYTYVKNAKLITEPSLFDLELKKEETLYKYVPKDVVTLDNAQFPIASLTSGEAMQIKEEVVEPLRKMCNDLGATNDQTFGGLILTKGYVSYEEQIKLYEQALIKYGFDNFSQYEDYPGQSEHQLGYTITFTIAAMDETQIMESEQVKWIQENAKKYGFVVRFSKEDEMKNGKKYQPLTLRYVGMADQEGKFDFLN